MVNQWSKVVVVATTCQTIGEVVTSWGPGDGENSDGENGDGDGDNGYGEKL